MATQEINAVGLLCPLPVLKLQKALNSAQAGDTIRLRSTDRAALIDVPHFCAQTGHELVSTSQDETVTIFEVRATKTAVSD